MQSVFNSYTARRKTKIEGKEIAILAALADECGYKYRGQKTYI
jgi:hypothetical protein